jgi:type I restriction enzyme S subunit
MNLNRYSESSAQPGLSVAKLLMLSVAFPPDISEQLAIAEALRDADALIESLEQLIAKKRAIKQGAMHDLLSGRRRLPGFSGDWTFQQLGNLLLSPPAYGINAPAAPYDTRHPAYIRITDITEGGRFDPASRASVTHPAAELYRLKPGDLVLARTGASTGKSYLYRASDGDLVFAGFLIRISPDPERLSPQYIKLQFETANYWNWVRMNSMRSGQPGINGRQYASMSVSLPPTRAEQDAIAEVLTDMDAELEALELRLQKARQIKQGMMQELLTGRVRLV